MLMDGLPVLIGALTGFVVGLTGVGGGAIMTPALILFAGVPPSLAVGTDLWFAAATKTCATVVHRRQGQIDWGIARYLWLGSLPTAAVVALLVASGAGMGKVTWLTQAIAIAVAATGVGLLKTSAKSHSAQSDPARRSHWWPNAESHGAWLTVTAGGVIGACVTLTSVGAGALGTLALLHLYPKRLTSLRVIATDIVHAIPLAAVAGTAYASQGFVDYRLLVLLLAGSIPSTLIGSLLAHRFNARALRIGLGAMLLVVAVKTIPL